MSLATMTALIKGISGRYDLFDEDGDTLNTIGLFYLNAASRMLDRATHVGKARAKYPVEIHAGDFYAVIQLARAIEKVYISDSVGETELDMDSYSLSALREKYNTAVNNIVSYEGTVSISAGGTVTASAGVTFVTDGVAAGDMLWIRGSTGGNYYYISSVDSELQLTVLERDQSAYAGTVYTDEAYQVLSGQVTEYSTPLYAAVNIVRLAPGASIPKGSYKTRDLLTADPGYDGILFYPPSDQDYTLLAEGLFYSKQFSSSTDANEWSTVHPDLLLEAFQYQLEVFYKNRQGQQDWMMDIERKAFRVTADYAYEGSAGVLILPG